MEAFDSEMHNISLSPNSDSVLNELFFCLSNSPFCIFLNCHLSSLFFFSLMFLKLAYSGFSVFIFCPLGLLLLSFFAEISMLMILVFLAFIDSHPFLDYTFILSCYFLLASCSHFEGKSLSKMEFLIFPLDLPSFCFF